MKRTRPSVGVTEKNTQRGGGGGAGAGVVVIRPVVPLSRCPVVKQMRFIHRSQRDTFGFRPFRTDRRTDTQTNQPTHGTGTFFNACTVGHLVALYLDLTSNYSRNGI